MAAIDFRTKFHRRGHARPPASNLAYVKLPTPTPAAQAAPPASPQLDSNNQARLRPLISAVAALFACGLLLFASVPLGDQLRGLVLDSGLPWLYDVVSFAAGVLRVLLALAIALALLALLTRTRLLFGQGSSPERPLSWGPVALVGLLLAGAGLAIPYLRGGELLGSPSLGLNLLIATLGGFVLWWSLSRELRRQNPTPSAEAPSPAADPELAPAYDEPGVDGQPVEAAAAAAGLGQIIELTHPIARPIEFSVTLTSLRPSGARPVRARYQVSGGSLDLLAVEGLSAEPPPAQPVPMAQTKRQAAEVELFSITTTEGSILVGQDSDDNLVAFPSPTPGAKQAANAKPLPEIATYEVHLDETPGDRGAMIVPELLHLHKVDNSIVVSGESRHGPAEAKTYADEAVLSD